jgi:hypothetical protein
MIQYLVHSQFGRIYLPDLDDIIYYPEDRIIYFETPTATFNISKYHWNFNNLRYVNSNFDIRREDAEIDVIQKSTWRELLNFLENKTDKFWILRHPITGDLNMPDNSLSGNKRILIINKDKIKKIEISDFNESKVLIQYKGTIRSGWRYEVETVGGGHREIIFEDEYIAQKFIDDYYNQNTYFFNTEYLNENKVINSIHELL